MHSESNSKAHLRFAVVSLVLVLVLAGGFAFLARTLASTAGEANAATATRGLVGVPLHNALAAGSSAPTAEELQSRAGLATSYLGGDVLAVRVWSDGELLFSRGAAMPADRLPPGASSARFTAGDGSRVFAGYLTGNGFTVEVDRAAAPVDNAIASLQDGLIMLTMVIALIAYTLVQGAFWLSMRRLAGQHRRLEFMYTRGQEIRSSLDLHDVVAQITHDVTQLAHAQYGFLALFEAETGELVLRATYDATTGREDQHQRAIDEWFLRRAVATNTTIVSTQPVAAYTYLLGEELQTEGQVAVLCVPLALRGRVVGAIALVRSASIGAYSEDERRIVEELTDQAVMAVEQALLFAKVRSYADELETSYDTTLKVLMAALDTKDDATEGHCERVAKLTAHLAREMGLPEPRLIDMERGALLHDVGKIGVPDAVLKKPKDLNEMEWEAMRKHPLLAGVMVGKVGFLEGALPILLYHHERYDGAGYPFGIAGDKIPVDARIFSVVDSYDAMTSDRPYRAAMGHEAAMAEIAANSGTQFDPVVVVAFAAMMDSKPHLQVRVPHLISDDHIDHDDFTPPGQSEDSAA
ncbi:MAG: HD domain-containing protein [Dehalococcoidia bacterium]|nr:HD domain-containing protein [Dehalococcoidia bacterium]